MKTFIKDETLMIFFRFHFISLKIIRIYFDVLKDDDEEYN